MNPTMVIGSFQLLYFSLLCVGINILGGSQTDMAATSHGLLPIFRRSTLFFDYIVPILTITLLGCDKKRFLYKDKLYLQFKVYLIYTPINVKISSKYLEPFYRENDHILYMVSNDWL